MRKNPFLFFKLLFYRISGDTHCAACDFKGKQKQKNVLWSDLINEWELTPEWTHWFNLREGQYCVNCKCCARTHQLSEALLQELANVSGTLYTSLSEAFKQQQVQALKIAEINSLGNIHPFLAQSPNLWYSEFLSTNPDIRSENLAALSYSDNFFDLVLTSETLEHVPNIDKAFSEIHRVLKPGGKHIFTTPVVWDRPFTRIRASMLDNQVIHHFPPSYHGSKTKNQSDYLVFYEFGADLVDRCKLAGFQVELLRNQHNPSLVTFITTKL
ncbi:MAG: methyltransferase domain-containing protein [Chitinophagia bacterium]|jgi:SAM-dependent methyltransferase